MNGTNHKLDMKKANEMLKDAKDTIIVTPEATLVNGTKLSLMAMIGCLLDSCYENNYLTKEDIKIIFDNYDKSPDDSLDKLLSKLEKLAKMLED